MLLHARIRNCCSAPVIHSRMCHSCESTASHRTITFAFFAAGSPYPSCSSAMTRVTLQGQLTSSFFICCYTATVDQSPPNQKNKTKKKLHFPSHRKHVLKWRKSCLSNQERHGCSHTMRPTHPSHTLSYLNTHHFTLMNATALNSRTPNTPFCILRNQLLKNVCTRP